MAFVDSSLRVCFLVQHSIIITQYINNFLYYYGVAKKRQMDCLLSGMGCRYRSIITKRDVCVCVLSYAVAPVQYNTLQKGTPLLDTDQCKYSTVWVLVYIKSCASISNYTWHFQTVDNCTYGCT